MSRLEDLISELCPEGVEYVALDSLFKTRNGYTPSKNEERFWTDGSIPWFRMEDIRENGNILFDATQHVTSEAIKGEVFPADSIIVATSATIGVHALLKVPAIANQRFTVLMLKDEYKERFDIKFVFYYCYKLDEYCKNCLNHGNFASVDMKKFSRFKFPIPPIEVQREIVRLLDKFVQLIEELKVEYQLRLKQYDEMAYRLLISKNDSERKAISDICNLAKGKTAIQKALPGEYPLVVTTLERKTSETYQFDDEAVCIPLVSSRGHGVASLNHVYYQEGKFALGNILCALTSKNKDEISAKYLYYYFECTKDYTLVPLMKGGANVSMHLADIEKVKVPVPSIDMQQVIVNKLEKFDIYCKELLPAEIEMREKQYAYYRELLLSFDPT